jgi:hypothetical protein
MFHVKHTFVYPIKFLAYSKDLDNLLKKKRAFSRIAFLKKALSLEVFMAAIGVA